MVHYGKKRSFDFDCLELDSFDADFFNDIDVLFEGLLDDGVADLAQSNAVDLSLDTTTNVNSPAINELSFDSTDRAAAIGLSAESFPEQQSSASEHKVALSSELHSCLQRLREQMRRTDMTRKYIQAAVKRQKRMIGPGLLERESSDASLPHASSISCSTDCDIEI